MSFQSVIDSVNETLFQPANAHDIVPRMQLAEMIGAQEGVAHILSAQTLDLKSPQIRGISSWDVKLTGPILINPQPSWFPNKLKAPDLFLSKIKDAVCIPGQVVLKNSNILLHSFEAHIHWSNPAVKNQEGDFKLAKPIDKIDRLLGNYLYLDRQHLPHHGHFLLNVLSMLWAWDILKSLHVNLPKIIISDTLSAEEISLLVTYGIRPENIVLITTPVYCEHLYIATPAHVTNGYTSPLAQSIWSNIARTYSQKPGPHRERIYVSRSKFRGGEANSRSLTNEVAVENLFRQYGFEIIYPEKMSIADQVEAFYHAKLIAGSSGANMYNMVFQNALQRAFVLTSPNFVMLTEFFITCSKSKELTLFFGQANSEEVHSNWSVNLTYVEESLREWLGVHR